MILQTYNQFLDEFFKQLEKTKIDISELNLDHIGYQASSTDDYFKIQNELAGVGKSIHEAVVGGRRVGIYKLDKPLEYNEYLIGIVEIVEPKKDQKVDSHWEHVEMTVATSIEDFMNKYSSLDWNTSALNRDIFPMLVMNLDSGMKVKFPRRGVLDELERQENATKYKSISATLIWSENYKELYQWYKDKFGFETIEQLNHPKDTGYGLRVGTSYLWIGKHSEVKGKNKDPHRIMFNISVDSVNGRFKELKEKDVEFIAEPFKAPASDKYFVTFKDLDGNIVQLFGDS